MCSQGFLLIAVLALEASNEIKEDIEDPRIVFHTGHN